jgi:hypothetical protein
MTKRTADDELVVVAAAGRVNTAHITKGLATSQADFQAEKVQIVIP